MKLCECDEWRLNGYACEFPNLPLTNCKLKLKQGKGMKSRIEREAYSKGFNDGAMTDPRNPTTIMIADYSFEQILKLIFKDQEEKTMAKNLKYQWCSIDASTDKEFLGWLYDRLQNVFGEKWDLDYMQRFNKIIDKTEGFIPDGPKMVVDHVDKQPMIIKRNGKIVYQD